MIYVLGQNMWVFKRTKSNVWFESKHMLWVSKRPSHWAGMFKLLNSMFWLMIMSRLNTYESSKQIYLHFSAFSLMSRWNIMLMWAEHEKRFITSGPDSFTNGMDIDEMLMKAGSILYAIRHFSVTIYITICPSTETYFGHYLRGAMSAVTGIYLFRLLLNIIFFVLRSFLPKQTVHTMMKYRMMAFQQFTIVKNMYQKYIFHNWNAAEYLF